MEETPGSRANAPIRLTLAARNAGFSCYPLGWMMRRVASVRSAHAINHTHRFRCETEGSAASLTGTLMRSVRVRGRVSEVMNNSCRMTLE